MALSSETTLMPPEFDPTTFAMMSSFPDINSTTESRLQAFSNAYRPFHGWLSVVVCLFGIPSNLLNIIVLTRPNMISSPTNLILTALAFSDLLTMLTYLPFTFFYNVLYINQTQESPDRDNIFSAHFTKIHVLISVTTHSIAIWLTVYLSCFRYIYLASSSSAICGVNPNNNNNNNNHHGSANSASKNKRAESNVSTFINQSTVNQPSCRHNSNGSDGANGATSNGPSTSAVVVSMSSVGAVKSKSTTSRNSRYNKVYFNYLFQRCLVQCRSYNSALIAILIICICCMVFCFPAYLLGRINCKVFNESSTDFPSGGVSNETCNFTSAANQKHVFSVAQDQGSLFNFVFYSQAILVKFIPCLLLVTFSSLLINSLVIINRNNKRLRKSSIAASNMNAKKLAKLNKLEKSAQKRATNKKKTAKRLNSCPSTTSKLERPHSKSITSGTSGLTIESFARNLINKMTNQTQPKANGRASAPNLANSVSELIIVNEVGSKKSINLRNESFIATKPAYDTLVENDGLEAGEQIPTIELNGEIQIEPDTINQVCLSQPTATTSTYFTNDLTKSQGDRSSPSEERDDLNNKACQTRSIETNSSLKKKLMKLKQAKLLTKNEKGEKSKVSKTKGSSGKLPKRNRTKEHLRTTLMLIIVSVLFLLTEFPQAVLIFLSIFKGEHFYNQVYLPLGDFMDIFALINNSINFLLYCTMSRAFRNTFYNITMNLWCFKIIKNRVSKLNIRFHCCCATSNRRRNLHQPSVSNGNSITIRDNYKTVLNRSINNGLNNACDDCELVENKQLIERTRALSIEKQNDYQDDSDENLNSISAVVMSPADA